MWEDKERAARRRRARCFHRIISGFEYGGALRFVTLTSSLQARNPVQHDLRRLFARLKRRRLLVGYIRVIELTASGLEHVHLIYRGAYIAQVTLSKMWEELHQSPVVDIRQASRKNGGAQKQAGYLAKYMAKEGHRRYSWAHSWVYPGFVATWTALKRLQRQANDQVPNSVPFVLLLKWWHQHLASHSPPAPLLSFLSANLEVRYREIIHADWRGL